MSIMWMDRAWREADLDGAALLVLMVLADHANDEGRCWPSVATVAAKARCSERYVYDVLNKLEQMGWLKRTARSGRSTVYTLMQPTPELSSPLNPASPTPEVGFTQNHQGTTTTTDNRSTSVGVVPTEGSATSTSLPRGNGNIPNGLHRMHTWFPHQSAIDAAVGEQRFMSADDYIDRYLMRCKDQKRTPRSAEWLHWFLDDDAKARQAQRLAERQQQPQTDDTGTPLSWRK